MIEATGIINFDLYNCTLSPRKVTEIIKAALKTAEEQLKPHCTGLVNGCDVSAAKAPAQRKDGQFAEA